MRPALILTSLVLLGTGGLVSAQTRILTDAGREVVISENGSWEFASQDQLATLPDGRRVRLKPDGSWQVDADAPVQKVAAFSTDETGPMQFLATSLIIETYREKVGKNTRYDSQTLIGVQVELSRLEAGPRELALTPEVLRVEDNTGDEYPVLAITPDRLTLEPGQIASFEIRVDGSPAWRRGKFYEVFLAPALTGLPAEQTARIELAVAEDRELDR